MLQWGGIWGNNWIIDPASETIVVAYTNTMFEGCNGPFRDEAARRRVRLSAQLQIRTIGAAMASTAASPQRQRPSASSAEIGAHLRIA